MSDRRTDARDGLNPCRSSHAGVQEAEVDNAVEDKKPQRQTLKDFGEDLFKSLKVGSLLEQSRPPIGPIQDMVSITLDNRTSTPGRAKGVRNR